MYEYYVNVIRWKLMTIKKKGEYFYDNFAPQAPVEGEGEMKPP